MSVEMVEGAWYRRRDGKVVGPTARLNSERYPWQANGLSYTDRGKFCEAEKDIADLVERVNQDGTPYVEIAQEPQQPEQPKRLPQVGERWRSRDGSFVTEPLEWRYGRLVANCTHGTRLGWDENGIHLADKTESYSDIVELVEEAQPSPPPTDSIEARQFGDNIHEAIEDAAERQVVLDNQLMQQAIMGKRGDDQRRIAEAVCVLGAKLLRKNNDYGSSAWKRPKLASHLDSSTAIRVRMSDKLERIESLASKPAEVAGESLEDTLDDLVAYWILLKAAPVEEAGQ